MIIRKLRDNRKQEDITVDDVPKGKFRDIEELTYIDDKHREHRYRLYEYAPGVSVISGDYKTDVTKYNGTVSDSPVNIFSREDAEIVVDRPKLVHELVQEYGEGRINVYKFGGNPSYESIFERKFIEVID